MAPRPGTFPRGDTDRTASHDEPGEEPLWERGERGKHLEKENRRNTWRGKERAASGGSNRLRAGLHSALAALRRVPRQNTRTENRPDPLAVLDNPHRRCSAWLGGMIMLLPQ